MDSDLLVQRIERFRGSRLLVDTNLLLLLFIGSRRPDKICSHKRISRYSQDDFALLEQTLGQFKRFATTPHILTEVSNLMGQCPEPLRTDLRGFLARAVQEWDEPFVASRMLVKEEHFVRFGLTDAAILDLPRKTYVVLTDDHALAGSLNLRKTDVLRFSHLQAVCL